MTTVSRDIEIGLEVRIGGAYPLFLIGGPCVIESEIHARKMAEAMASICKSLDVPFIFKSSFDKANRSSLSSYRGPGLEKGLDILKGIRRDFNVPVLSDVHEPGQVEKAAGVLDVIQIPAFLCRQTDLVLEVAKTGKPMNIKKAQFLSPNDMSNVVEKVLSQGNEKIILTERGTSFGYNTLIFDVKSVPIMKRMGFPVVIDASHSVQKPGGLGASSGGDAEFIPTIARAGVSAGADGLFLEVHDDPDRALSDGLNSFNINNLTSFLAGLVRLRAVLDEINSAE